MAITGIIEDGVRDKLLATSAVTALLSTRISVERIAESSTIMPSTKAKLTYAVIAKDAGSGDIENTSAGTTEMATANLTIGVFGPTWEAARNAAIAVRNAINAVRGSFGNEFVSYCFVRDMMSVGAVPDRDDEIGVPGYGLAVDIAYRIS